MAESSVPFAETIKSPACSPMLSAGEFGITPAIFTPALPVQTDMPSPPKFSDSLATATVARAAEINRDVMTFFIVFSFGLVFVVLFGSC